jgi:hypothetical protein
MQRDDLAVMTTAQLTTWWLERERALQRLSWRVENDVLVVQLPDVPEGATLAALLPGGDGTWRRVQARKEVR